MSQVCTTVIRQVRKPGTGIFVEGPDASWDAIATSVEGRGRNALFRYSFDPLPNNAYFSGIYDYERFREPAIENYIAAVEIQGQTYRVWLDGEPASETYRSWSPNDRFHIQYERGRITVFRNQQKVWPT